MNGWKFWKVLKMSLHDCLELFRQAIEKVEGYGYAESIEINEEIRPNKQYLNQGSLKNVQYL